MVNQVGKVVRRALKWGQLRGEADSRKSEEGMVWDGKEKVQGDVEERNPGERAAAFRELCAGTDDEPVESVWVRISGQSSRGGLVVDAC